MLPILTLYSADDFSGPTGLLGAIHCLQNVILSGGDVRIFEKRGTLTFNQKTPQHRSGFNTQIRSFLSFQSARCV